MNPIFQRILLLQGREWVKESRVTQDVDELIASLIDEIIEDPEVNYFGPQILLTELKKRFDKAKGSL